VAVPRCSYLRQAPKLFRRICKRKEPVLVQAFGPEPAVERFSDGIIRHDDVDASFLGLRKFLGFVDPGLGAPGARKCWHAVARTGAAKASGNSGLFIQQGNIAEKSSVLVQFAGMRSRSPISSGLPNQQTLGLQ